MKTTQVLSFVALLVPGLFGLPVGDSLLKRMASDGPTKQEKEEATGAPPDRTPRYSMVQHQEPKDEEPTPGAFQGDMMLTEEQWRHIEEAIDDEKAGRKKRKARNDQSLRWPHKIIPYVITPESSGDAEVIRAAIDHWEQYTCLRFEPRNSSHASALGHENYVSFIKNASRCNSILGMAGQGKQHISIGSGCERIGVVAHEIGHTIGFHHEQSRPDRDNYIKVLEQNIQSGKENNFYKYSWNEVTTRNVEYDIDSIMHYGSHSFSKNGLPTITTFDPLDMYRLGNRDGLSAADVTLANLIYECENECSNTDQCLNGGYHDANCNCVCPPGYSGALCQDDTGPTTTPPCIQRLTSSQGEITSPNYPSNYENDQKCMFLIEGPPISTIELTFHDFAIENSSWCGFDVVRVLKDDIYGIGKMFCGNILPPVQNSSSNQMLVYFTSNGNITRRGFRASYVIRVPSPTIKDLWQNTLLSISNTIAKFKNIFC